VLYKGGDGSIKISDFGASVVLKRTQLVTATSHDDSTTAATATASVSSQSASPNKLNRASISSGISECEVDTESSSSSSSDSDKDMSIGNHSNNKRRVIGTPAFMAPELFGAIEPATTTTNKNNTNTAHPVTIPAITPASDVWALGVTLYQMIVGKTPWWGSCQRDLEKAIVYTELALPDSADLDPHLVHLLRRMLDKDPMQRITLDMIMDHDWVTKEGSNMQYIEQPLTSEFDFDITPIDATLDMVDGQTQQLLLLQANLTPSDIQDALVTCLPNSNPTSPAFNDDVYMSEPNSTTTSPNNNTTTKVNNNNSDDVSDNQQQQQYHNWTMNDSPKHTPTNAEGGSTIATLSSSLQYEYQDELECPASPPLIPKCSPYILENGPNDYNNNWLPQTNIEAAAQILALERENMLQLQQAK
jgi:serine/threonine protein kinase